VAESAETADQKYVVRTLIGLRHRLNARREIRAALQEIDRIGTEGSAPQLETTLSEILTGKSG
jgi:hypothetical protein